MTIKGDSEWLNCLLETGNKEFIIQNTEWRLSENPGNLEIWKFYFDYFETQDGDTVGQFTIPPSFNYQAYRENSVDPPGPKPEEKFL